MSVVTYYILICPSFKCFSQVLGGRGGDGGQLVRVLTGDFLLVLYDGVTEYSHRQSFENIILTDNDNWV